MTARLEHVLNSLLERNFCNHCLGRQFSLLGHGLENYERGWIVRHRTPVTEEAFDPEQVPGDLEPGGSCSLCGGFFNRLSHWTERLIQSAEPYELNTYLVGSRLPDRWLNAEDRLRDELGIEHAEPVKAEVNRLVGKRLSRRYDGEIEVDHEEPDLQFIVDLPEDRVELQVSPLYIYGRYNKYSREIPQTVWHCRECRGHGCDRCDGTGKMYQESVQELIQPPLIDASDAEKAIFHGAGREDINARCLAGREFVLELKQPRRRNLDLEACGASINTSTERVEVSHLQRTHAATVAAIKQQRSDKTYRAVVDLEQDITPSDLDALDALVGEIRQETPFRVDHRRASKVRTRTVYRLKAEKMGKREIELVVKAEAGTYIKELISGDEQRTKPNVAERLGTAAECRTLDVIDIDHYGPPS